MLDFAFIIAHKVETMQITIFTDGACDVHAQNQPGGWAAILRAEDDDGQLVKETVISGGAEQTTNNQMELTAVIEALKALNKPAAVTIASDSRYVIDIAKKSKKISKNKALWQDYFRVAADHQISWKYVEGHAGNVLNERCDKLAVAEKRKLARATADGDPEPALEADVSVKIYLSTQYAPKNKTSAWAALLVEGGEIKEASGLLPNTTELEATLIGAIASLEAASDGDAALFTAQEYLAKGMNYWLEAWEAKGWKTKSGNPVKYQQRWQRLCELTKGRQVHFHFVKSREGNPHFERGKTLATELVKGA